MLNLHDWWTLASITKKKESHVFADSDTSVDLRVSQVPGSPKVAIFLLTTTDKPDYLTPCACVRVISLQAYYACKLPVVSM